LAQETPKAVKPATEAEVSLLNRLAKNGFLGEKRGHYLKAKSFTGEEVVEALVEIDKALPSLQGNGTQAGATHTEEDLRGLLDLVKGRKDALWDKKVQVWSFEKRVKDMMVSVGKLAASSEPGPAAEEKPAPKASDSAKAAPDKAPERSEEKPAPVPTPVPEVTQAELDEVADQARELVKKLNDLSAETEKRLEKSRKETEETQRVAAENIEQLKILKKLVDQVQANLDRTGDRLEEVSLKASKNAMIDSELRQELTVLHKDMRDNSQDISVLKQEMAKLEAKKAPKGRSPLDEALTSPWVAGGALIVGLAALVVSITK